MNSKFIPKIPVISVSGMKIAVIVVSVRMISLVRCAVDEKCSCTADSSESCRRRAWACTRWMWLTTSLARTCSASDSGPGPLPPTAAPSAGSRFSRSSSHS